MQVSDQREDREREKRENRQKNERDWGEPVRDKCKLGYHTKAHRIHKKGEINYTERRFGSRGRQGRGKGEIHREPARRKSGKSERVCDAP